MGTKMEVKGAAMIGDFHVHLLDHIAPLASFLQIPLIANEEETALLAQKFYPEVATRFCPDLPFRLQEIAAEFDVLYNCQYWQPSFKECFRSLFQKEMQLIFCPHGQSDKGYKSPLLELYRFQDIVLIYGDLLQEMLVELKIWDQIKTHIRVGNYRFSYHQLHKKRGENFVESNIFSKLCPSNLTLLYAPTWNDADSATTFFLETKRLIQELPTHWNLLIKLHPLLEQRNPALFHRLVELQEKRANFLVIDQFPLIYPILEKIDVYLGDYSSIGYDVLAFQKPMFFFQLPHIPNAKLHHCGQIIDPSQNTFLQIERGLKKSHSFLPQQKALYRHAFDLNSSIHSQAAKHRQM